MVRLYKKLAISLLSFIAFYICGHLALYCETLHNSILAGSAIFSTSLAGSGAVIFKIYNDFFA
jgi:hypothetical protein